MMAGLRGGSRGEGGEWEERGEGEDGETRMSCCGRSAIARSMSLPTTMTVREATVGPVLGTRAVSGVAITTSAGENPAASAAIFVKTVLVPWPISVLAARISIFPSGRPATFSREFRY